MLYSFQTMYMSTIIIIPYAHVVASSFDFSTQSPWYTNPGPLSLTHVTRGWCRRGRGSEGSPNGCPPRPIWQPPGGTSLGRESEPRPLQPTTASDQCPTSADYPIARQRSHLDVRDSIPTPHNVETCTANISVDYAENHTSTWKSRTHFRGLSVTRPVPEYTLLR